MRPTRPLVVCLLLGCLACGSVGGRAAADDAERRTPVDLRPTVDAAVARAAAWLRTQASPDGTFRWSVPSQRDWSLWSAPASDQGLTALAALALVRAGVPRTDPAVLRALDVLRRALTSVEPPPAGADARTFTYAAGALLWMLSELRPVGFDGAAAQAALAISRGQGEDGGWSYVLPRVRLKDGYADVLRDHPVVAPSDLSNAQFAMLGLLCADRMGVWRGDVAWTRVRDSLRRAAAKDGSFSYRSDAEAPDFFRRGRRLTTAIAAANLFVALRRTGVSREDALADPTMRRALNWLKGRTYVDALTGKWSLRDAGDQTDRLPYYEMIAIERLGAFTDEERIGGADWFRVGAGTLLASQKPDGSWPGGVAEAAFMNAVQNTVFSILFLTRALDAVPVVSPAFTTADFVANREARGALFDDLVGRGALAHAASIGDSRVAWRRAFVTIGERGLSTLVRVHAEGPPSLAGPIHELLCALTGVAIAAEERDGRTIAWTRWLFDHRGRLEPSATGDAFVDRR